MDVLQSKGWMYTGKQRPHETVSRCAISLMTTWRFTARKPNQTASPIVALSLLVRLLLSRKHRSPSPFLSVAVPAVQALHHAYDHI